jgi:hypothetical protein
MAHKELVVWQKAMILAEYVYKGIEGEDFRREEREESTIFPSSYLPSLNNVI